MTARRILIAVLTGITLSGCDDPFEFRWEDGDPQEAIVYALDVEQANVPSGFNMVERRRVIIESSGAEGRWDFAVDRTDGRMVLVPPRVLNLESRAGIAQIPQARFDDVREAPSDTLLYEMAEPVDLELGTVYVIRSRELPGSFRQRCFFYGKLEPLEIDAPNGILRFKHDTNPVCNDLSLVPSGS